MYIKKDKVYNEEGTMYIVPFETLIGKTLNRVERAEDALWFFCNDGDTYIMYHEQSCCEEVTLEDICGDLNDLLYTPILKAEVRTNEDTPPPPPKDPDAQSFAWTFYQIATIKGYVDLRWYGASNGCYAEWAELYKVECDTLSPTVN